MNQIIAVNFLLIFTTFLKLHPIQVDLKEGVEVGEFQMHTILFRFVLDKTFDKYTWTLLFINTLWWDFSFLKEHSFFQNWKIRAKESGKWDEPSERYSVSVSSSGLEHAVTQLRCAKLKRSTDPFLQIHAPRQLIAIRAQKQRLRTVYMHDTSGGLKFAAKHSLPVSGASGASEFTGKAPVNTLKAGRFQQKPRRGDPASVLSTTNPRERKTKKPQNINSSSPVLSRSAPLSLGSHRPSPPSPARILRKARQQLPASTPCASCSHADLWLKQTILLCFKLSF